MKKTLFLITISGLVLAIIVPLTRIDAQTIWSFGSQGEEIKNLQEILKTDPTIYPEGLTTGYYGNLTQRAIQRIQARCGLSQTGVVDEETERCIYPIDYKVKVISPNGGENWDRSQIQTITWEAIVPTSTVFRSYPFWNKASIDLFKIVQGPVPPCVTATDTPCLLMPAERSVFVRHIATVDLLSQAYSWRIQNSIPNGENYIVRITVGKNIIPLWAQEQEQGTREIEIQTPSVIWPAPPIRGINWDESDAVFQISGTSSCITCPECPTKCEGVSEVIKILQNLVAEINKAIALLMKVAGQ